MASEQILKSTKMVVSYVTPRGSATVIGFVKGDDGVRNWCWLSRLQSEGIRPGMVLTCELVVLGDVCTTYWQNGEEKVLKVPRRQVRLGGHIGVDAPEGFVAISQIKFSEAARRFAQYDPFLGEASDVEDPF